VTIWSGVLPEADPAGDLGIWVASVGEPDGLPRVGAASARTVTRIASGRGLRVACATERQRPSIAVDAGCGAVFDGVLFNRAALAAELRAGAGPSPGEADLVLRAYRRWGQDFVGRMKGIFALVLWDPHEDRLFCARDRTGVYPLFYSEAGRALLVSTSVDALLRQPTVTASVDPAALAGHLICHWNGPEDTYFAAVKRLPAGCSLEVRGGERRVRRYWDPAPLDTPVRWVREDELEHFDALLEQAVGRCLELGPGAVYLSGGIDSVAVASVAADLCRRHGRALPFALMMDLSVLGAGETGVQTGVAASLGLPFLLQSYEELAATDTVLDESLAWSATWPWPIAFPSVLPYVKLGLSARAHGCGVLLTGEGGDEWLVIDPRHAADLLRRGDILGFARLLRALARSYPFPLVQVLRTTGWFSGLRPLLARSLRGLLESRAPDLLRHRRRRAILARAPAWAAPDPVVRRALEERIAGAVERDLATPEPASFSQAALRRMLDTRFDDDFERSRRTGLRLLHPLWDADVVEFLYRMPPESLNAGGRTKGLVRQRLDHRFPALGFGAQRKVVLPDYNRTMIMTRAEGAWEKQGAPTLAMLGVVDEVKLRTAMAGFFARPETAKPLSLVWNPLNLEAWVRNRV
jgi:asparagine synthase (glutamine-hydrolysing)